MKITAVYLDLTKTGWAASVHFKVADVSEYCSVTRAGWLDVLAAALLDAWAYHRTLLGNPDLRQVIARTRRSARA